MIYLIDEKKLRQEAYGWTNVKFEKYPDLIRPIYTYDEIKDNACLFNICWILVTTERLERVNNFKTAREITSQ
jgi:hypothetical protein